jgi:hypothetical protein
MSANFPGFDFMTGFFERYVEGMKGVGEAWNDVWQRATDKNADYTFGAWSRDVANIWARNHDAAMRLFRYPFAAQGGARPAFVSMVADKDSSTVDSGFVGLSRPVGTGRDVQATDLERMGDPGKVIPRRVISVELNDRRDAVRVTIPLGQDNDQYERGNYVGFLKLAGGGGAPVAIVLFANDIK